jgi:hypothetical protein
MFDPNRPVFCVQTACREGVTRDDRCIHRYFLKRAAKALGIYWPGFWFRAFRREAVTAFRARLDLDQALKLAGRTTLAM